jgi:hypothetical protein
MNLQEELTALQSGKFPPGLMVNLAYKQIRDVGAEAIANACAYQNHFNHKKIIVKGIAESLLNEARNNLIAQCKAMTYSVKKHPEFVQSQRSNAFRDILPRIMFFATHPEQTQFEQPTKSQRQSTML